jgi:hypothetical protein
VLSYFAIFWILRHEAAMATTSRSLLICALFFAAPLAAVACGDGTPQATPPPQPTSTAPAETAPPATAETAAPSASASASASAAPEASASASASASAAPDRPKSSGRPPVLLSDAKSITDTFGFSPGAKLELGEKEIATLRIPEGAFTQATNVTFALDTKCKTTGLVTGKLYKITAPPPPPGTPAPVVSNNGSPFVLLMPTSKKANLNLAIGNFDKDAKGNETIKWKIVAPTKTDDAAGMAEFDLETLPDACLHLTNKAPN